MGPPRLPAPEARPQVGQTRGDKATSIVQVRSDRSDKTDRSCPRKHVWFSGGRSVAGVVQQTRGESGCTTEHCLFMLHNIRPSEKRLAQMRRKRYTCEICNQSVYGAPGRTILCGNCAVASYAPGEQMSFFVFAPPTMVEVAPRLRRAQL